jgi:hypothetical protein
MKAARATARVFNGPVPSLARVPEAGVRRITRREFHTALIGNVAHRTRSLLTRDAYAEQFVGNAAAHKLLIHLYCKSYAFPA